MQKIYNRPMKKKTDMQMGWYSLIVDKKADYCQPVCSSQLNLWIHVFQIIFPESYFMNIYTLILKILENRRMPTISDRYWKGRTKSDTETVTLLNFTTHIKLQKSREYSVGKRTDKQINETVESTHIDL